MSVAIPRAGRHQLWASLAEETISASSLIRDWVTPPGKPSHDRFFMIGTKILFPDLYPFSNHTIVASHCFIRLSFKSSKQGQISKYVTRPLSPWSTMPAPTSVDKNIWVAAGDGDLSRVRDLIEHQSLSPNVPDSFTYTPMHAAASYGHLDILTYLISKGGNVNVSDEDGDTPLYTVENIETACLLVDSGADVMWRNHEGLTPAASLEQEFPQVADYLNSIIAGDSHNGQPENTVSRQEAASERLTSSLMSQLGDIAQNETTRRDEELRQAVGRAVLESLITGYTMTNEGADSTTQSDGQL